MDGHTDRHTYGQTDRQANSSKPQKTFVLLGNKNMNNRLCMLAWVKTSSVCYFSAMRRTLSMYNSGVCKNKVEFIDP